MSNINDAEMKLIWALNPAGDYRDTMTVISIEIGSQGNGLGLVNGQPISANLIRKSYENYLNYWKQLYGRKDPRYISKDNQLKSIKDFVIAKDYTREYNTFRTPRDMYLFRDMSDDEIKKNGNTDV
jgi:hypothetical protein